MKHIVKTVLSLLLVLAVMLTATVFVSAKELYVISDSYLEVGSKDYTVDSSSDYTVFAFSPAEEGEYTLSVGSGKIGIVSYTDMWVQNDPSAENVNATSIEWECTAVGQGIYVAVTSADSSVTIEVKRKELIVEQEVPWTIYENQHTPQPFEFTGNFQDMDYVETFDTVVDEAVFGEDGFYHLNSADGPVLYACLNDAVTLNLQDANSYGQLKEVLVDENGDIYERTDFYNAFEAYFACVNPENGLYPLTIDLIEMFKRVGNYHGWYGEEGFIGGNVDDAWMFACYYTEGDTVITTTTGDPNTTATTRTTASTVGRPVPSAPSEETTVTTSSETTVPSDETGTTAPSAEMSTTVPVGETNTTAPSGETDSTIPNGETSTTAPSSETNTTTPDGEVSTTAPNGDTTVPSDGTDTTASSGETDTTAPENGNNTTAATDTGATTVASGEQDSTTAATQGTTAAEGSAAPTATPDNVTTTTDNKVGAVGGDSAPTGDVSNASLFMMIAVAAAVVILMTSKKATSK